MEEPLFLKQFETIEYRLEKLIQLCREKDQRNSELKARVEKLEEELRAKDRVEKQYHEEKALIRSRIDQLLARLEDITESQA